MPITVVVTITPEGDIEDCPSKTEKTITVTVTATSVTKDEARSVKQSAIDAYDTAKEGITCPQTCANPRHECKRSTSATRGKRQFRGWVPANGPKKNDDGTWNSEYEIEHNITVKCKCKRRRRRIIMAAMIGGVGITIAILVGILISSCSQVSEIMPEYC